MISQELTCPVLTNARHNDTNSEDISARSLESNLAFIETFVSDSLTASAHCYQVHFF